MSNGIQRLFLTILIFSTVAIAGKIDNNLLKYIVQNPDKNIKVWIFFKDKGPFSERSFAKVYNRLSERAIQRRSKVNDTNIIRDIDYPVYSDYKEVIQSYIIKTRRESRWLNAISALVKADQVNSIEKLDFVQKVRLVHIYKNRFPDEAPEPFNKIYSGGDGKDSTKYGPSFVQLDQIGVIALHKLGYTGKGVLVAMLDDGFNQYDTHVTFNRLDVLDTYDFVHNDKSVADRDSLPKEGWHGTAVLSVIAGYTPGKLIGVAYNAIYLLAKTEDDNREIQQEEDNWVAGLEWAEAKGADIVSSSVGYFDFDGGIGNYSWEDMDGNTAITTLAANIAESLGLVVVNSAGNEGRNNQPNTLIAPADGKYVITVGAVDINGNYLSFSSYGPTADGRIKPDLCALGTGVVIASNSNIENFTSGGSGTSFSAPLTAGAIALLLEAYPRLTPHDVREAIRKTASQATTPDNYLGYGILNIKAAYDYIKNDSLPEPLPFINVINAPNPFSTYTRIQYSLKSPSVVSIKIYDIAGRQVLASPNRFVNGNDYKIITGKQLGATGIYFYHIEGKEYYSGKQISKTGKLLYFR